MRRRRRAGGHCGGGGGGWSGRNRSGRDTIGLRRAAAAAPPGGVARAEAGGRAAVELRRLRPARHRRRVVARAPARPAAGASGGGPVRPAAAGAPHADHDRPRRSGRLVRPLRGRRSRRPDRQGPDPALPARQAGAVEGEAPPHGRLRRGRLPHAQGRRGRRLAAARAVRRRRHPQPRRRVFELHGQVPRRAGATSWRRSKSTHSTGIRGGSGPSSAPRPTSPNPDNAAGCRAR